MAAVKTTWKPLDDNPKVPSRLPDNAGGKGTKGRDIQLVVNYFPIRFNKPNVTLYHFDLDIEEIRLSEEDFKSLTLGGASPAAAGGSEAKVLPVGLAPEPSAQSTGKGPRKRKGKGRNKAGKKQGADAGGDVGGDDEPVGASAPAGAGSAATSSSYNIPKGKKRKIFQQFIKELSKVFENHAMAFDGEKSCYCPSLPTQLKASSITHKFQYSDCGSRGRVYKVTLKKVNEAKLQTLLNHLNSREAMTSNCSTIFQMLEVMFNYERTVKYEVVARNRFFDQRFPLFPDGIAGLNCGKEAVTGFFSSLRPARWKDAGRLLLNVDVAHTAFYKTLNLIDFLKEVTRSDILRYSPRDLTDLIQTEVVNKDIRVVSTHTPFKRKYKVTGVSKETSNNHFFDYEADTVAKRKVNITEYIKLRYKFNLQFPDMICLKVGTKSLMPIEVCSVAPNQRVKGKLNAEDTAEFIKHSAMKPGKRLAGITTIVRNNDFNNDPAMKGIGMEIDYQPLELTGRVLPAPIVVVKEATIQPRFGVWDSRGKHFLKAATFDNWVVVNFARRCKPEKISAFMQLLVNCAKQRGMTATQPDEMMSGNEDRPEQTLNLVKSKYKNVKLIVCILETTDCYKKVKCSADRNLKVITQCIKSMNVVKCQPATAGNLIYKINAKLGGVNHDAYYEQNIMANFCRLFKTEHVLVMGADVNHPPANDKTTPSLVAVVGSIDIMATTYAIEVRHQSHRVEGIVDMMAITKNLLLQYKEKTNHIPSRIIMYRDGVSETQFTQVLAQEMKAMREACTSLHVNYTPAITFFCVQKRHHTRLYCKNANEADKSGNVPAGTVVDQVITHKSEADFFLCSHQGLQGTSKPSHYHVLWDDSSFSMDQLQLITYCLCHNYSRCSRAVSMPTPAYYAHLAAFRAKIHLEGAQQNHPELFREDAGRGGDNNGSYSDDKLKEFTFISKGSLFGEKMFYV